MAEPGNIDLYRQPEIRNPDGSISTVDSSSYNIGGREVLLPSVTPEGKHLKTKEEILAEYDRTGRHLGIFDTPEKATKYAQQLHEDYAAGKYRMANQRPYLGPLDVGVMPPEPQAEQPQLAEATGGAKFAQRMDESRARQMQAGATLGSWQPPNNPLAYGHFEAQPRGLRSKRMSTEETIGRPTTVNPWAGEPVRMSNPFEVGAHPGPYPVALGPVDVNPKQAPRLVALKPGRFAWQAEPLPTAGELQALPVETASSAKRVPPELMNPLSVQKPGLANPEARPRSLTPEEQALVDAANDIRDRATYVDEAGIRHARPSFLPENDRLYISPGERRFIEEAAQQEAALRTEVKRKKTKGPKDSGRPVAAPAWLKKRADEAAAGKAKTDVQGALSSGLDAAQKRIEIEKARAEAARNRRI